MVDYCCIISTLPKNLHVSGTLKGPFPYNQKHYHFLGVTPRNNHATFVVEMEDMEQQKHSPGDSSRDLFIP